MSDPAPKWNVDRLGEAMEPVVRPPIQLGALLGRYRLIHYLGEGAMGGVYSAEDTQLRRKVALKVLHDIHAANPIVRQRFEREARAAASISHPNVLQVFDAGEDGGRMFLSMELMEGASFRDHLDNHRKDRRGLISILMKVARGVAAAHERGIVHRDLKPANILLSPDGTPKVADFGLAHLLFSETMITRSGTPLGTPNYMSPEQVRGDTGTVVPASDVYALGVMLYEILTGSQPHQGANTAEVFARILSQDPRAPRSIDPGIERDLETICLKALEAEPSRRYPTAREFADDLMRHLEGETILARPPGLLVNAKKWAGRHRALATVGVMILLLLPAAVALHQSQGRQAEALKLLEIARPMLDKAQRAFYHPDPKGPESAVEARRLIEKSRDLAPKLVNVRYALGRALDLSGESAKAEAEWREALRLDPRFGPAHFQLGRLLLMKSYATALVSKGEDGFAARRVAVVIAREAADELRRATEEGSGFDDALDRDAAACMLAYIRADSREMQELATAAIGRHGMAEGSEVFHWILGLATSGEERVKHLDDAISIRPRFEWACFSRAQSHLEKGDLLGAIEDYTLMIEANPVSVLAWSNRASMKLESADLKGAIEDCDRAIAIDPARFNAWVTRGKACRLLGRWDQSIADYSTAIRLAPDFMLAHFGRAQTCRDRKDWQGALRDSREVLKRDPKNVGSLYIAAVAQAMLGDHAGAVGDYNEAVRLGADDPGVFLNRARTLRALSREEEAAADCRKALSMRGVTPEQQAEARQLLTELEASRSH